MVAEGRPGRVAAPPLGHCCHNPESVVRFRSVSVLLLLILSTCDTDGGDDAACEASDEPSSVTVDNRTGATIEQVTAAPCDGGEAVELALPAEGLEFSTQATVELPGPGCWLLQWSGGGCSNGTPYRTSTDVCPGDTYEWQASVEGRVCSGGW